MNNFINLLILTGHYNISICVSFFLFFSLFFFLIIIFLFSLLFFCQFAYLFDVNRHREHWLTYYGTQITERYIKAYTDTVCAPMAVKRGI